MPSGKSNLVDITGEFVGPATEKAVLFNDGTRSVWLPRSEIEIAAADNGRTTNGETTCARYIP